MLQTTISYGAGREKGDEGIVGEEIGVEFGEELG